LSILEDFSSPIRDMMATEDRTLSTRFEGLEERIGARFSEIERRLEAAERLASERHRWTMEAVARLADINELRERMSAIESAQKLR
jgi:hypothetical protein